MTFELKADWPQELGVSEATAAHLSEKINAIYEDYGEDCWPVITREVLNVAIPFEAHEYVYRRLSAHLTEEGMPPMAAWVPSLAIQFESNIQKLMQRQGFAAYGELYQWSVDEPASFWGAMVEILGIVFREPFRQVLNTSEGVQKPQWLSGSKLNIADSCFSADPNAVAVIWRNGPDDDLEEMTYDTLNRRSNQVANGLRQAGFNPGDALAVDMAMTVESVYIYLGIVKAGCRVISIADSFTPREIATRLRIGEAKGIFTTDVLQRGGKSLPMYAKVKEAEAPRAVVLVTQDEAPDLREGDLVWDHFLADEDSFEAVPCDPHNIINILFSSGTTGDPKAIPWNHTTPIKAAADGCLHQDIHPGDVVCWPTNLGWMMGPWLVFATLINRGTIALYGDAPNTEGFCRFVQDAKVDVLGVVPSLVKAWRASAALDAVDWTDIKLFSSTGECSNLSDMLFLMSRAGYKPVIEYCGGTEVGGGYLTGTVVHPGVPAAFSTPALGSGLVVLDEENNETDLGQVFLIPPAMGLSTELINRDHQEVYYSDTPTLPDGRLLRRHGDQLEKLGGGFYRALGRADDTMNLGGIKTSSAELERVMMEITDIDEAAAVAVPPEDGGPSQLIVFAVLLVDRDEASLVAELQEAIRFKLNPLFKIHEVITLDALPRTASGKVMRRVLRRRYLNHRGQP